MRDTAAYRRGRIASVHIAKADLALDDATYRDLLKSVTGHDSAGKCTVPQLKAVLAEMRAKGWTPRPCAPKGKTAPVPDALRPLHSKIWALCRDLGKETSYADDIIKRQTKNSATLGTADRTQLAACVTALVRQQAREKTKKRPAMSDTIPPEEMAVLAPALDKPQGVC